MITARNYAAQADAALGHLYPQFREALRRGQHFALPDGGCIFDDNLRGIRGTDIKLPFPIVVVEYFAPDGGRENWGEITSPVSKRVVIGTQTDNGVDCVYAGYWDKRQEWIFAPVGVRAWNDSVWLGEHPRQLCVEALIHTSVKPALDRDPVLLQSLSTDATSELWILLELCEALSCKNVVTEPIERIDPKINARRIRKGKLPLYETRRLVIEVPQADVARTSRGGTHASPRQHLRRGHIRRLPSGNVWVNAHVVGSAAKGVIEKTYAVTT